MKKTASNSANTSSNNSNSQTTNMKNQNTSAPKKVFTYERNTANPASLQIHPLLIAADPAITGNVFTEFYKEFNHIEIPVVTEDGFVITHAADVLGAQELGLDKIEVVVMKNAKHDDVIKFISFKHVISHGKNRSAISQSIKYLTNYLTNTDSGKQLASEFDATKTRSIVCDIMGISTGTHQNITKIEKHAPELLAKIDNGEITKTVNKVIPFESRKRYEGLVLSSEGKKAKARLNLASFMVNFKELGELNFSFSGNSVTGALNGVALEDMIHRIDSDYNDKGETQHVQSHTFIPKNNDRFSIQIIIRDLDQLGDSQQLAIAA
jgi:hypothetical protein